MMLVKIVLDDRINKFEAIVFDQKIVIWGSWLKRRACEWSTNLIEGFVNLLLLLKLLCIWLKAVLKHL